MRLGVQKQDLRNRGFEQEARLAGMIGQVVFEKG